MEDDSFQILISSEKSELEKEFERILSCFDNKPKCECGSEKVGSNKHSEWCDKYERDV